MIPWLRSEAHRRWLESETDALLAFGAASAVEHGFGWLDADGAVDPSKDLELWINCRMTHVFALGSLMGRPEYGPLADHGIRALTTVFRDAKNGGYVSAVGHDGRPTDTSKQCYAHAFVVLAAASGVEAGREGARELLDDALDVLASRFFEPEHGMHAEGFDRAFGVSEPYRGINANMHAVEALLAASAATGDVSLLHRATGIIKRALGFARAQAWRLPEHFSPAWQALPDYNREDPAHPFRPFGATIGHWFEWARLALHARAGLAAHGIEPPKLLLTGALGLMNAGADAWGADGHPGFVYTVDFEGTPVVAERMHWVIAEATGAASATWAATGDPRWAALYQQWWEYAARFLRDLERGSWHHELDAEHRPSTSVWAGKPDIYHAVQTTLIPRLPLWPPLAGALRAGMLDSVR